jgi:hypothetical protein
MKPEQATISRCAICNKPFAGPRLAIVGKGMDLKNNRIAQFTEKLTRHLFDEHSAEAQQIMMSAAEYQGVLILATFQTEDPDMREQMDLVRWKVHQKTLACRYSDEQIAAVIEKVVPELVTLVEMKDTATLKRNLRGLIQNLRDNLEEPGKYTFAPMLETSAGKAS